MDIDKITGSGLSQTVLFSVVLFPLVAFVNNLLDRSIRSTRMFSGGSEWITLQELGIELQ